MPEVGVLGCKKPSHGQEVLLKVQVRSVWCHMPKDVAKQNAHLPIPEKVADILEIHDGYG